LAGIKGALTLLVPHVVYIQHKNTFLHCPKEAKPPVIEIEKW